MTTYNEELQREIERVTLKGNADKETMRKLASIIFRMDQRILQLEREIVVDEKPAAKPEPVKEEVKPSNTKTIRPPQSKTSGSTKSDENPSDKTSEV